METQNQIKRTLSRPESIERIQRMLDTTDKDITRTAIGNQLCREFEFIDPRGENQLSGCLKALRDLESKGHFILPAARVAPGRKKPPRLGRPVPEPRNVPADAGNIDSLRLIRVHAPQHSRLWNEMMIGEHPRGSADLVGRKIRYLICSESGWLGGIGFGSAALKLEDRDKWLGWDEEGRRANLHHIVNMTRFLIRPSAPCRNLASRALGMAARALPGDFESIYGYRPLLLESFVDAARHSGACHKAANWIMIGKTKGRGRRDRERRWPETVKDIYMYPLDPDYRRRLGLPDPAGIEAAAPEEDADGADWIEREFGNAPLGHKRMSDRLIRAARIKWENPGVSFNAACAGSWAEAKGYYRFIEKPDDSAVSMPNILAPHRKETLARMRSRETVLCVQDGTDLNFASLDQCENLGVIGKNQTSSESRGLHLHSMLAVDAEGLPLGVLGCQCDAPRPRPAEDKRTSAEIPVEEKKTFRWIAGQRDLQAISHLLPDTRLVSLMDREGDCYEVIVDLRANCPDVDLLVRARHDRATTEGRRLRRLLGETGEQGLLDIQVERRSARAKKRGQKERKKREARQARVRLMYRQVSLKPPSRLVDAEPIRVWALHALEEDAPEGEEPIDWLLLTTVDIASFEEAVECVRWYCLRWRVEDWHRVLKSGCRAEDAAFRTAERLKRDIAINMVIAWRIMLMTLLGRRAPSLPAEILFSDIEIEVLEGYAKKKRLQPPDDIGAAVKLVAKMGGYLGRASDPAPGHEVMWRGYSVLQRLCEGYEIRRDDNEPKGFG